MKFRYCDDNGPESTVIFGKRVEKGGIVEFSDQFVISKLRGNPCFQEVRTRASRAVEQAKREGLMDVED